MLGLLSLFATPGLAAEPSPTRGLDVIEATDALPDDGLGITRYRAVLFSAQDYAPESGIPDLRTPSRDVEAVGSVLRDRFGFEVEIVADATEKAIISRLDTLKRETQPNDAVIVYFAGHGLYDTGENRGYWLPTDAVLSETSRWVSNDDVSAKLRAIPARHVLMIIDSCFSGMFRDALRPTTESELAPLKALASKRSRVVLASGGNEPVSDGGRDGLSVFAYYLRQGLAEAQGRYVVLDTLFPELRARVQQNADQTPQQGIFQRAFHEGGQLVLENQTAPKGTIVARSVDRAQAAKACKAQGEAGRSLYDSLANLDAAAKLEQINEADRRARERLAEHACVDHQMGLISNDEYARLTGLLAGEPGAEETYVIAALREQREVSREVPPPDGCEASAEEGALLVKAQQLLRDGRSGGDRSEDREAMGLLQAAAKKSSSAPLWTALARARLYAGESSKQVSAAADRAAKACPAWGVPDNYRSTAFILEGNLKAAEKALASALDRSPRYAFAHYNLGVVKLGQGKVREGLGALDQALIFDPLLGEAHFLRGRVLTKLGKLEEAVQALESAADLRPRQVDVWQALAAAYEASGNEGAAKLARKQAETQGG
ncbi:MAG: caspase family protein [Myxococcota bacterium]